MPGDPGGANRWRPVTSLAEGDHVHLDALMERAPEPGSPGWLPVIDGLARHLSNSGGRWLITFRLGECDEVPSGRVDVDRALAIADAVGLEEPPAVYRLRSVNLPNRWVGENHRWTLAVSAEVTEVISVSRSEVEAAAYERFSVAIDYEI